MNTGKHSKINILFLVTVFLSFTLFSFSQDKKIRVSTANPIFAQWIQSIAGDKAEIKLIKTDSAIKAISSNDLELLKKTDIYFSAGMQFEPWAVDLATSGTTRQSFIFCDLSQSVDLPEATAGMIKEEKPKIIQYMDPETLEMKTIEDKTAKAREEFLTLKDRYYYLSPIIANKIYSQIADTLSKISPAQAAFFKANAKTLSDTLAQVVIKYRRDFARFRLKQVIICGNSGQYFLTELGLRISFIPGEVMNKNDIDAAASLAKKDGSDILISLNPADSDICKNILSKTGGKFISLDFSTQFPNSDGNNSYINLLQNNIKIIHDRFAEK